MRNLECGMRNCKTRGNARAAPAVERRSRVWLECNFDNSDAAIAHHKACGVFLNKAEQTNRGVISNESITS